MKRVEDLVQLDVKCERCGKREARRVVSWRADLYRHVDPERIVETVRCKCGHQYAIKARAYQDVA